MPNGKGPFGRYVCGAVGSGAGTSRKGPDLFGISSQDCDGCHRARPYPVCRAGVKRNSLTNREHAGFIVIEDGIPRQASSLTEGTTRNPFRKPFSQAVNRLIVAAFVNLLGGIAIARRLLARD